MSDKTKALVMCAGCDDLSIRISRLIRVADRTEMDLHREVTRQRKLFADLKYESLTIAGDDTLCPAIRLSHLHQAVLACCREAEESM